jgi:hypothetical protein
MMDGLDISVFEFDKEKRNTKKIVFIIDYLILWIFHNLMTTFENKEKRN